MEIKTSTPKNIQGSGTHKDHYGLKYDFDIEMENGDCGQYSSNSETQNKFEVGKEVSYEWYPGKYPKIKPHYEKGSKSAQTAHGNDNVQLYIIRQSSLKIALDFHNITIENARNLKREDVAETSEFFTQYVLNGLDKIVSVMDPPKPEDYYEEPPPPDEKDDLPF